MRCEQLFINRISEPFLSICAADCEALSPEICSNERNVAVDMDALSCLPLFSRMEKLVLRPGEIKPGNLGCLKGLKIRALKLDYVSDEIDDYTLDLSWFPALELLTSQTSRNFKNADRCRTLRTLRVQNWMEPDLEILRGSQLTALELMSGRLRSLRGIGRSGLSLSVSNQRALADVSALECMELESLEIERCPKIDLEALPALPDLEYLALYGSQHMQSLALLRRFPKLRHFLFDIFIEDGDLAPLNALEHSVSLIDRKHYNRKDRELPKSAPFRSDRISAWLAILPPNL